MAGGFKGNKYQKRYQRLLKRTISPYGYRKLISEKTFLKVQQRARGLGVKIEAIDFEGMELRFSVQSGTYPNKSYTVIVQLNSLEPTDIIGGRNIAEVLRNAKLKCYCTCPAFNFWGYAYKAWRYGYGLWPQTIYPRIRNPHLKGYLCFKSGTRVITNHGLIPIENIKVGDFVFSHTGNMRKVLAISSHMADETITLRANRQSITCTPEHKMLACPHNQRTLGAKWQPWDKKGWFPVNHLELGDYLFRRNIQLPESIYVAPHKAWLLGYYLANGTTVRVTVKDENNTKRYHEGRIVFKYLALSCNASKRAEYIREFDRRDIKYKDGRIIRDGSFQIYIADKEMIEFIVTRGRFTRKSSGTMKRMPDEVLYWNRSAKKALIAGFFFGDGMFGCGTSKRTGHKQPFYIRFYNTNYQMMSMLYTLLCEDYMPRFVPVKSSSWMPNKKQMYSISLGGRDAALWAEDNKEALLVKKTIFDPASISGFKDTWVNDMRPVSVREISHDNSPTMVHNIQVEEDESYLIEGQIISKNCKHTYAALSTFPFLVNSIGKKMKDYWTAAQVKQIGEQVERALDKINVDELVDEL